MKAEMQEIQERLAARRALDEQRTQRLRRSEVIAGQVMTVLSENEISVDQAEEVLRCVKKRLRSVRV